MKKITAVRQTKANDPKPSLQMIQRPLMAPDELKSMPKSLFIIAEAGTQPHMHTNTDFMLLRIIFRGKINETQGEPGMSAS